MALVTGFLIYGVGFVCGRARALDQVSDDIAKIARWIDERRKVER
jgi:hypothetical protein